MAPSLSWNLILSVLAPSGPRPRLHLVCSSVSSDKSLTVKSPSLTFQDLGEARPGDSAQLRQQSGLLHAGTLGDKPGGGGSDARIACSLAPRPFTRLAVAGAYRPSSCVQVDGELLTEQPFAIGKLGGPSGLAWVSVWSRSRWSFEAS